MKKTKTKNTDNVFGNGQIKPAKFSNYFRIFKYIGEFKKYAILTPLCIIGEVVMEVLVPFILPLINTGIENGDMGFIVSICGVMLVLSCLSLVFGIISSIFASRAGAGLAKNIRKTLFGKIQDFSFKNTDRFSTASLVTRLTTDITNTQMSFMMMIRLLVRSVFMVVSSIVFAAIMNARLSLIFTVIIPILAFGAVIMMKLAFPRFTVMLRKFDNLNSILQQDLIGIRVVKAFVREDFENEKFKKVSDELCTAQMNAEKLTVFFMPIIQTLIYSTLVTVILFGGQMVLGGEMQVLEISSFITYAIQVLMSLMMMAMVFITLIISGSSITRIFEVVDEKIDITDGDADPSLVPEDGSISFRNVNFEYLKGTHKHVLKNINLEIKSGETVGVIGSTGSSKTSLVQLIPRLYDIDNGELIVGGHPVKDYKLKNLRSAVSMVLQKNVLFSGTIRDNLVWGKPDATLEEIEEACKIADAHDFIMSFPDGYDTVLGQGGVNISGGQKQRLTIARAVIAKPKILILDDSTSAVDTATDLRIRQALAKYSKDTTVLIIAQRIASVEDADKIVVMENGEINGLGTNDELLANNAIYREIVESQKQGRREN